MQSYYINKVLSARTANMLRLGRMAFPELQSPGVAAFSTQSRTLLQGAPALPDRHVQLYWAEMTGVPKTKTLDSPLVHVAEPRA